MDAPPQCHLSRNRTPGPPGRGGGSEPRAHQQHLSLDAEELPPTGWGKGPSVGPAPTVPAEALGIGANGPLFLLVSRWRKAGVAKMFLWRARLFWPLRRRKRLSSASASASPAGKSERQQEAWELEMASLPRHVPRPPAGRLPSSHFGCLPVLCVVSSCGWSGSCHCSWGIWGRRWRGRTLAGTRGCPVRGHGFAGSGLPCSTGWEWFRHVLEQTGGQHQLRLLVTPQPFYSIYLI